MGGGHMSRIGIGSLRHVGIERHVHADTGESDEVLRVDQRIEVGHDIAFDVVLPCHDTPAVAPLRGGEDLRHIVHGHQFEAAWFSMGQRFGGVDRRLMREGALRAQIEQLSCAH